MYAMVTSGSIDEKLERGMLDEKKLILFFVAFNAAFLDMDRRRENAAAATMLIDMNAVVEVFEY